jgi:hypothetical protein
MAALNQHPDYIIISSCNDFAAGDFVEPSTLDGGKTMHRLARELATVKAEFSRCEALAVQPPPPAAK